MKKSEFLNSLQMAVNDCKLYLTRENYNYSDAMAMAKQSAKEMEIFLEAKDGTNWVTEVIEKLSRPNCDLTPLLIMHYVECAWEFFQEQSLKREEETRTLGLPR